MDAILITKSKYHPYTSNSGRKLVSWGVGSGEWGMGRQKERGTDYNKSFILFIPRVPYPLFHAQSPIPNPQSPTPTAILPKLV
ncbi:hypothetical protein GXM_04312 [Nostoc sphaeroides CCNUC1]|uniref:Uncharacterized protein n=1 Tax=Nostoc sphaeroides CCNUC1 TaxID=2653204 RepID=A0A5P8W2M8_9NOSO|nr:hypothetical protein GXM_04312 [Nostoc sphaeroides CCNUC1]